ncbi:MAG: pantetheine-phosphate adenylyltransferase [Flavobacteriaceae bacterium]|nr:pantetheine-phosphate adenylyltransferase [Flavobacteriaceae bacterium]
MKKAIFAGSFDPITTGHLEIVEKALPLFDEIIIAIGINNEKKYFFSLEQRKNFIEECFKGNPKIKVATYTGLTVDFCKENKADFIIRGLRNSADFEFENAIAQTNRKLGNIETIFFLTSTDTSFISSSIVRDILKNNGNITGFVPEKIEKLIAKYNLA